MNSDGGGKQDYFESAKWYRKAAEQGNVVAQLSLANMYTYGKGVKQDYFEAVKWNQKAAEQGNAGALAALGIAYRDGKGVKQDRLKAKEYFGESCEAKSQWGCDLYRRLNSEK